jgi:hypothetical protein
MLKKLRDDIKIVFTDLSWLGICLLFCLPVTVAGIAVLYLIWFGWHWVVMG